MDDLLSSHQGSSVEHSERCLLIDLLFRKRVYLLSQELRSYFLFNPDHSCVELWFESLSFHDLVEVKWGHKSKISYSYDGWLDSSFKWFEVLNSRDHPSRVVQLNHERSTISKHPHINVLSPSWVKGVVACFYNVSHVVTNNLLQTRLCLSVSIYDPRRLRELSCELQILASKK